MEMEVISQPCIPGSLPVQIPMYIEAAKPKIQTNTYYNISEDGTSPNRKGRRGRRKASGGTRHPRGILPAANSTNENRRLKRRLNEEFDMGRPRAPYNTTQFLMEYHERVPEKENGIEAELLNAQTDAVPGRRIRSRTMSECVTTANLKASPTRSLPSLNDYRFSDDSSMESESTPPGVVDDRKTGVAPTVNFEEVDFAKTYNNIHFESLFEMSKHDLISEVGNLEKRVEQLEGRIELLAKPTNKSRHSGAGSDSESSAQSSDKVQVDRGFIKCLQQEICVLQGENKRLRLGKKQ